MPITLVCWVAMVGQAPVTDFSTMSYPLSSPIKAPKITVDSKAAPDLASWGDQAKGLATHWFPLVCQLLSTQKYHAPKTLNFVFRLKQDAPAYCAGNEISFSADWVRKHPDDFGMVIHEMTHAIQAYPNNKNNTGWLVEGIADYIRWWRYEPEANRTRIDFSKATYHDAYRTTAAWLAWVSKKYNSKLVPALDLDLRNATDPIPTFEKLTGKNPETLWNEFRAATEPRR